jgi:hypothetical protein
MKLVQDSKIGKYLVEFRDLLGDTINSPYFKKFPKKIKNELKFFNGRNNNVAIELGFFVISYFGGSKGVEEATIGLEKKVQNKLLKIYEIITELISKEMNK